MRTLQKLYIPDDDDGESAAWRTNLVDRAGKFDLGWYFHQVERVFSVPAYSITSEEIQNVIAENRLEIDDVEYALLLLTRWGLDADLFPDDTVLTFFSDFFAEKENWGLADAELAKKARSRFNEIGRILMAKFIPEIRAKLAALELIARLPGRPVVTYLVSLTPKYLGCEVTQDWIAHHRQQAWFSEGEEKERSKVALDELSFAIKGDRRKHRAAQYSRWFIHNRYQSLYQHFQTIKWLLKDDEGIPAEMLWKWMWYLDVPVGFMALLMASDGPSPAELARA